MATTRKKSGNGKGLDLTTRVLIEIRDEVRGIRTEHGAMLKEHGELLKEQGKMLKQHDLQLTGLRADIYSLGGELKATEPGMLSG